MRYASAASGRTKDYVIEAQRIAYADGGIYLVAFVPAYGQVRTFAAERIRTFAILDEVFDPQPLPADPFPHSLGVNSGSPQKVVIEFDAGAAPYIREREWHPSQEIVDGTDGAVVLTLHVCNDRPLRTWVLGFGASARVVEPVDLAKDVFDVANAVRARYLRTAAAERLGVVSMRAS